MIGVDLVYIPEFTKQKELGGKPFMKNTFNKSELVGGINHLAGLWAAKEAVIKAMGDTKIMLKEIVIDYRKSGQPKAVCKDQRFDISISHHGDYAIAVAVEAKL